MTAFWLLLGADDSRLAADPGMHKSAFDFPTFRICLVVEFLYTPSSRARDFNDKRLGAISWLLPPLVRVHDASVQLRDVRLRRCVFRVPCLGENRSSSPPLGYGRGKL